MLILHLNFTHLFEGNFLYYLAIAGLGDMMEEILCNIEFLEENGVFIAKLQSPLGGLREYRGVSFEEVLDQVMIELQQEFEGVL
ncbi:hypothetical protein AciM339_0164 [Aciduliprofundum sp. MAR08-339]|nr:hypothetical protein AciM339_0164 [Aciduliprofundum sp. MAR08-339]